MRSERGEEQPGGFQWSLNEQKCGGCKTFPDYSMGTKRGVLLSFGYQKRNIGPWKTQTIKIST